MPDPRTFTLPPSSGRHRRRRPLRQRLGSRPLPAIPRPPAVPSPSSLPGLSRTRRRRHRTCSWSRPVPWALSRISSFYRLPATEAGPDLSVSFPLRACRWPVPPQARPAPGFASKFPDVRPPGELVAVAGRWGTYTDYLEETGEIFTFDQLLVEDFPT